MWGTEIEIQINQNKCVNMNIHKDEAISPLMYMLMYT